MHVVVRDTSSLPHFSSYRVPVRTLRPHWLRTSVYVGRTDAGFRGSLAGFMLLVLRWFSPLKFARRFERLELFGEGPGWLGLSEAPSDEAVGR